MTLLIPAETRLLVQGLGRDGGFQASRCRAYGTAMVAGVHPGRGETLFEDEVPVFESAARAVEATGANVGLIFVPAPFAADAIIEQADAGLSLIVAITEGIPVMDMVHVMAYLQEKSARLLGPNCPGFIIPSAQVKVGIIPGNILKPGRVGVVSRSGTLTYEAVIQLTELGIGQSTCVGIGGDPLIGTNFIDVLKLFNNDPETDAVVLIGEIGGTMEQDAAEYIKNRFNKPIIAFIAGATAPPGKRMGHAGAIISGGQGGADQKIKKMESCGITVAKSPSEIGKTLLDKLTN